MNHLAEALPFEPSAAYRDMVDEGLRLHRAFFSIKSAEIRTAVLNLVIETVKNESEDRPRFPPPMPLRAFCVRRQRSRRRERSEAV